MQCAGFVCIFSVWSVVLCVVCVFGMLCGMCPCVCAVIRGYSACNNYYIDFYRMSNLNSMSYIGTMTFKGPPLPLSRGGPSILAN